MTEKCDCNYEVVRDRGLFSNAPRWIFCPKCGTIKTPPKQVEMVSGR